MNNLAMQNMFTFTENSSFVQILKNGFSDLDISVFVSAKLKKSWRIEKKKNKYSLVIPSIFVDSPNEIKTALLKWVHLLISNRFSRKKAETPVKNQIKELENIIYDFLKTEHGLDRRRTIVSPEKKFKETKGKIFDLKEVFYKINDEYFNGELKCFLRWGKEKSRTSYHTVCTDEYKNVFHLITIAGIYNQKDVPYFAVEAVMYHEMLHIVFPPIVLDTRRNVHHKLFRNMEKSFPYYKEWKNWQNKIRYKKV
jgi:hypothetical protein